MIEKYWEDFYKKSNFNITSPSKFALTINNWLKSNNYEPNKTKIIDLGCGNGRDASFFQNNGYNVVGWDNSSEHYLGDTLIKKDILLIDIKADIYYARFFFHAITEETLDNLLQILKEKLMGVNSLLCFETRSSRGITNEVKSETNFKSSVGDEHFRMLYSYEYLVNKMLNHFDILYSREGNGYAKHESDDPYVIRMILTIKK